MTAPPEIPPPEIPLPAPDDWSFEACQVRLQRATMIIRTKEDAYRQMIERAADSEAVYRAELAKAFEGYRKDGQAVEAATTLARRDVAVIGRERDYAAAMVKLRADQLEGARDSRLSLWRLIEWARGRDLKDGSS